MTDFDVKEIRFEQDIEEYLQVNGGFQKDDPKSIDRKLALVSDHFLTFWKIASLKNGNVMKKAIGKIVKSKLLMVLPWVKNGGFLRVTGFHGSGIKFKVVFWKPETSINATSQKQYEENVLHCTRKLHYSLTNEYSIDIVIFLMEYR